MKDGENKDQDALIKMLVFNLGPGHNLIGICAVLMR